MTATAPPPVANRIAHHLPPPLPQTPEERQQAWADALSAAMLFYQRQLASPFEAVAERAARAIFELEKTRLRHGRDLAGATVEPPPRADVLPPLENPFAKVKACEDTLAAAARAGAFGPPPTPTAAERPATFEAMTDAELVAAFERDEPGQFAVGVDRSREMSAEVGWTLTADEAVTLTRHLLAEKVAEQRAAYERTRNGGRAGAVPVPPEVEAGRPAAAVARSRRAHTIN